MTSSPPVKGNGGSTPGGAVPPTPGETPPPPATKWPRWRVCMLIGALILLGAAILETVADDPPRWLITGIFFAGYVLLAYGFFTALSARHKGPTPRGRG